MWRYLLGVTAIERYAREMTRAGRGDARGGLAAGAGRPDRASRRAARRRRPLRPRRDRRRRQAGWPRADDRLRPRPVRRLRRARARRRGRPTAPIAGRRPHVLQRRRRAAGRRARATSPPAGVAFAVDLRLRPGSKGSGFAASLDALRRYYEDHGDLWERQTLTRARLVLGDRRPRPPGAGDAAAARLRRAAAADARSRRSGRCARAWSSSWARRRRAAGT